MNPASDLFLSVRQDESVDQDTARCVVRLTTNCFISGGRVTFSKVLSRLKRKSELTFDEISLDDCNDDLDFGHITNLMSCEDGIYYLDPDEMDWDSDEYGYNSYWYAITWKLVPINE